MRPRLFPVQGIRYNVFVLVECPSCKARYALNPALISGSRGARVRCRKCGDRFEVRNPEPPPPEAVEPPGGEPAEEPVPPEPPQAPTVVLKVPTPEDRISSLPFRYREGDSHRSRSRGRPRPAGGKAPYYMMAGLVAIVLGITVALLFLPELRRGQPSDPGKSSPDVHIFSAHYLPSARGVQKFVIRGSVRDTRKGAASPPIRLHATLFDAEKRVLAEKTFLAGADTMEIGLPTGIAVENAVLQEGWIPFVTVFFDTGGIAEFSVVVVPM
ncbi:MAG: zinc-ribbon domain-containing protein [Actinomycetota bacterium]